MMKKRRLLLADDHPRDALQWLAGLVSGEQEVMGAVAAGEPSS